MSRRTIGDRINDLIDQEKWSEARVLIQKALESEPDSHWLLTQLAETHYEQRKYRKALDILLKSRAIIPDCPLTLWHLAGTLDALGHHGGAIRLYTWLLNSEKSARDDSCWESDAWTEHLKTDCIYRLGVCFQKTQDAETALFCFRRYLQLMVHGLTGSYSAEETIRKIQELHPTDAAAKGAELDAAAKQLAPKFGSAIRDIVHLDAAALLQP